MLTHVFHYIVSSLALTFLSQQTAWLSQDDHKRRAAGHLDSSVHVAALLVGNDGECQEKGRADIVPRLKPELPPRAVPPVRGRCTSPVPCR
jgi:hypothetical protein